MNLDDGGLQNFIYNFRQKIYCRIINLTDVYGPFMREAFAVDD